MYLRTHPEDNLYYHGDLDIHYESILQKSRDNQLPTLDKYLFYQTKPILHSQIDYIALMQILDANEYSSSDQAIACLILSREILGEMRQDLTRRVENTRINEHLLGLGIKPLDLSQPFMTKVNLFLINRYHCDFEGVYLAHPALTSGVRDFIQYLFDTTFEDCLQHFTDMSIRKGYLVLLQQLLQKYPKINCISSLPNIITSIGLDPEHFLQYIEMITYLVTHHMNTTYMTTYEVFLSVYTGDVKRLDDICSQPLKTISRDGCQIIDEEYMKKYYPYGKFNRKEQWHGLFMTALLTNHVDTFHYLFERCCGKKMKMYKPFFVKYITRPRCINPAHLPHVIKYIPKTMVQWAIKQLKKDGYPQLANIILSV